MTTNEEPAELKVYETNSDIRWIVVYPRDPQKCATLSDLLRCLADELDERGLAEHVTNIEVQFDDHGTPLVMALTELGHDERAKL